MGLTARRQGYYVDADLEDHLGSTNAKVFEKIRWLIEQGKASVGEEHEGRRWVHFTYGQIEAFVPGQSLESVKHAVRALKREGLLIGRQDGRGQWLAVNFYKLASLLDDEAYLWYCLHSHSMTQDIEAWNADPVTGAVAGVPLADDKQTGNDDVADQEPVETPVEDGELSTDNPVEANVQPVNTRSAETAHQMRKGRTPEVQDLRLVSYIYKSTNEKTIELQSPPPTPASRSIRLWDSGGGAWDNIIPFEDYFSFERGFSTEALADAVGHFWRPYASGFSAVEQVQLHKITQLVMDVHKKNPHMPELCPELIVGAFTLWWYTQHPIGKRGEQLLHIENLQAWGLWEAFCAFYVSRPNPTWFEDFERLHPDWRDRLTQNYAGFSVQYQADLKHCCETVENLQLDYAHLISS